MTGAINARPGQARPTWDAISAPSATASIESARADDLCALIAGPVSKSPEWN